MTMVDVVFCWVVLAEENCCGTSNIATKGQSSIVKWRVGGDTVGGLSGCDGAGSVEVVQIARLVVMVDGGDGGVVFVLNSF